MEIWVEDLSSVKIVILWLKVKACTKRDRSWKQIGKIGIRWYKPAIILVNFCLDTLQLLFVVLKYWHEHFGLSVTEDGFFSISCDNPRLILNFIGQFPSCLLVELTLSSNPMSILRRVSLLTQCKFRFSRFTRRYVFIKRIKRPQLKYLFGPWLPFRLNDSPPSAPQRTWLFCQ